MTRKAYIVANEQQEREVLEKLEREGLFWISGRKATEWIPSQTGLCISQFPYALVDVGYVAWRSIGQLKNDEIVYDGRKEEKMSEKYVVSQEFMNGLKEWNNTLDLNDYGYKIFVSSLDIYNLPVIVSDWWANEKVPEKENNNRLIAIIRWVNGQDVFEVEKPKKWVVRSKNNDTKGIYSYVSVVDFDMTFWSLDEANATRFDTKEEAESWANAHQEVVSVEE